MDFRILVSTLLQASVFLKFLIVFDFCDLQQLAYSLYTRLHRKKAGFLSCTERLTHCLLGEPHFISGLFDIQTYLNFKNLILN
jgi:hypothetical protein